MSLRRVVPNSYDPKGERFLIASRFPTPLLACAFLIPRATVKPSDTPVCYLCTCEQCGNILSYRTCLNWNSRTGNSFIYDRIPESFSEVQIILDPPPQYHFNIYLCQICESNSHCGYECSQRHKFFLFKLCQVFHNNILVVKIVGFFLKPTIVNPRNIPSIIQSSMLIMTFLVLERLMEQMEQLTSMCEMVCQIIQKKQEEKWIEEEQAAKAQNWKLPVCYDDDDDEERSNSLKDNIISGLPPCAAVTPNEPVDSLSMGDEHLDTIPATESDEFIKSSVENLFSNPSESEDENGCDVPACFTTFSNILFHADYEFDSSDDQSFSDEDFPEEIFSNPLFEEEIISMKIDPHHFNAESDLIESLLNRDSSITPPSSKIDSLLDEFAGELTLLKSIPSGIDETDCDPEDEIRLTERLLYNNSSPRPPEEFVFENSNANIESFSPSPIPIKDGDSHMEEIDLSFNPDDQMPSGIEDDDYDSERDIPILEELLDNYSLSLPENESFRFDIPSFSRPSAKPPDDNIGISNIKVIGDIYE
uniref:Uncharacterized protein n=1 Tax=Tanacetum cinerariifolium TaxID=118510 RepID=A0A6L2NVS9_TANCI|nr:hypothetical protein [Tanacetum cinerariifolium]